MQVGEKAMGHQQQNKPQPVLCAIEPLFGPLERIAATVPTPHGEIDIDVRRDGGTITVPAGVEARVRFDDGNLPARTLPAGTHQL